MSLKNFIIRMPKSGKKGKKKGGKKKKKTIVGAENIIQRLYKCYERNCALTDSQMCVGIKKALKACLENTTVLEKVLYQYYKHFDMLCQKKYWTSFLVTQNNQMEDFFK